MVAPVLLGLILGAIEVGRYALVAGNIGSAVRETARLAMVSSATSPSPEDETSLAVFLAGRLAVGDPELLQVRVTYAPANDVGAIVRIEADYQFETFLPGVPRNERLMTISRVMEMAIVD